MKFTQRHETDAFQPAIDTPCDNCGAIYDLLDCSTCACGVTLCPDCICESFRENNKQHNQQYLLTATLSHAFPPQNNAQGLSPLVQQ